MLNYLLNSAITQTTFRIKSLEAKLDEVSQRIKVMAEREELMVREVIHTVNTNTEKVLNSHILVASFTRRTC